MRTATSYKSRSKCGGMDASIISQMKAPLDEHHWLKKMYAEISMQGERSERSSWERMAGQAVALHGVSNALACRCLHVSETSCRYSAKLNDDNEEIADLLIGLTRAQKT